MRLIDADKWIEELSKNFTTPNYHPDLGDAFQSMESEQRNEDIADLIMQIESQPTAYDVDKVVEQMETFASYLDDDNEADTTAYALINIVKGGLEE